MMMSRAGQCLTRLVTAIHGLELAKGRSQLRPGDDGYVPPGDVQSIAGNEAGMGQPVIAPDSGGGEGSGEHVSGAIATVISDD